MDFDGLRTDIIRMISGASVKLNVEDFQNDMITFADKDDVLTLLIHLGYLAYDNVNKTAFIPNEEIRQEFLAAIKKRKCNKDAETAIRQIKDKRYTQALKNYTGDILLVGINYNKKSKAHECVIERFTLC